MKTTAIAVLVLLLCVAAAWGDESADQRARALRANVKTFRLELAYHGDQDKPFYQLTLSAEPIKPSDAFSRRVQIDEPQTLAIIDHLAKSGALDRAHKTGKLEKLPRACYLLRVQAGDLDVTEILGWDLAMLRQLDGLRAVLQGEAATSMDLLIGRLSGLRQAWEKEARTSAT
ncbi:MAG: hypothetical protein KDA41_10210 [Planctomycetales bacterium]|nr:hypothetical protein [Planctomycetales bacterium]